MRSLIRMVVGVTLVVVSVVAYAQPTPSIQGVWRVTAVVVTGANASTNGSPQPGLYIFTKQHYSIVAVNGTAPRKSVTLAPDAAKLTDADKLARYEAWDPFTANSGTYTVTGSTLTTKPIVAKNPTVMEGPAATREFKIEGKTLILIQKSAADQPASETRTTLTRVE